MESIAAEKTHLKKEETDVRVIQGNDVLDLLQDKEFQLAWDALYSSCTWATVFQSPPFVTAWYMTYTDEFLPLLVLSESKGSINGLVTLARDKSGLITGAGADQAEYQVWLSGTWNSDSFAKAALAKVLQLFPDSKVQLKYIPGQASVAWLSSDQQWSRWAFKRELEQPLLRNSVAHAEKELKKKNRREKINRLKRLGEVYFERIVDTAEFVSVLNELTVQYDFRKEAMYNTSFFLKDPLRKKFLISLFSNNLLHATVLRVNGHIIASNVGVMGKECVHLQGLNTHSPMFAKFSPGILHFLMLSKLLGEEGIHVFDLTPGADAYKTGIATEFSKAYHLEIRSGLGGIVKVLRFKLADQIKKGAIGIGIEASVLKKFKRSLHYYKQKILSRQWGRGMRKASKGWESQLTAGNTTCTGVSSFCFKNLPSVNVSVCNLQDLLYYEQRESQQTRWEFLQESMSRLENGQCCYTWSAGTRLLACAWCHGPNLKAGAPGIPHPPHDVYCHPLVHDRLEEFLADVKHKMMEKNE